MKGSDKIEMTINIGGEILTLETQFENQDLVREAEFSVRQYYNNTRRKWPDSSDRKILAMAAYQFSYWRQELIKNQKMAMELINKELGLIDDSVTSM
ncbi:MAG: cell division protein ZapA [Muribaculaceae bacterium]|nr:cell division protein ZapA [Muribaculaceae bacterium]